MDRKNVLYIRVSTEEQKESGHSLEYQKNKLIGYCKECNMDNYEIYDDAGYSAASAKRPKYKQLLEEIKMGTVGKVIMLKLDRFTRDLQDFLYFSELCEKKKVDIISLSEKIDDTPEGKFILTIHVANAELEIKRISKRTIAGLTGGLEKGKWVFGGKMPLGFSKDEFGKLLFNEESKIVKEIFDLDYEGYSFQRIGEKIKEKYDIKIYKSKIETILKSTIYYGYVIYNDVKYELIEPLVPERYVRTRSCNEGIKVKKEKKRNKIVHDYKLKGSLKYEEKKESFFVETHIRRRKGKEVRYVYYTSLDKKVKINEKYIMAMVEQKVQGKLRSNYDELLERQSRITEMYELGDITRREYIDRKKKAAEEIVNGKISDNAMKEIEINVNMNYDIIIKLKEFSTSFNYQEELKHYR